MGGIKNKLSKKLSNKTIPLSDYRLTSPFSQRGTKSSLPLAKGRQMSVAHRWGRITKYTSLACLTLAILSTLVLNIISSYSNSSTRSNAEPVSNSSTSTLANNNDSSTCDPNNTNAESCISLSITSSSFSTSTGGDDANLSLQIPREGGIATSRHTVTVVTNNVAGWGLVLSASNSSLVNTTNKSFSINSLPSSATIGSATTLANNTWGVALPYGAWSESGYYNQPEDYVSTNNTVLSRTRWTSIDYLSTSHEQIAYHNTPTDGIVSYSRRNIYYGVRVDNPSELLAGDYQAEVVYTATTNEVPMPTNLSVSPNSYELGSGDANTVTISADSGLTSAYKVWIDLNDSQTNTPDSGEECINLNVISDTRLTCNLPTDDSITVDTPYTIYVQTQAALPATIPNSFTYTKLTGSTTINSGTVAVDIDDSMIPVVYTGSTTTSGGKWTSVSIADIKADPTKWFDYTGDSTNGDGPRWANAVTVKDPSKYKDKSLVVDEADILGYWVYIPRYAYKVMRYSVNDKYVSDSTAISNGGFEIVFETKDTPKKTPTACSNSSSSRYYQDCSNVSQEYGATTGTSWATHPAFTWGTEELNGFWIGKFETTGTESSPTVLPNEYHQYPSSIGDMYDVAKSMGVEDPNNKYGNTASTNQSNQNNNNLAISTSHMLKNSEWGAVTYLASSKYGAGINNVQLNISSGGGGTGKGPSGGAYNTADGQKASTTNNIYGVYDMVGGAWEYVMGSYTSNASRSMTNSYLSIAVKPPYVDLYVNPPFSGNYTSNNNLCTWATCGGHALYETKNVQPVSSNRQSWGGDYSNFVYSSDPWFKRGGYANNGSNAGVFASVYGDGSTYDYYGFRVALLVNT